MLLLNILHMRNCSDCCQMVYHHHALSLKAGCLHVFGREQFEEKPVFVAAEKESCAKSAKLPDEVTLEAVLMSL